MVQEKLAVWYAANKRDLPFRGIRDPYRLWVAEVIFQQTRIHQGINYYHRFLKAFPQIGHLAAAPEKEVLRIWQGLGYYSRARNMHQAAREIMDQGGVFPRDMKGWQKLKGVGPYIAAAIISQAYNISEPAVDGNVFRFLARYYGIHATRDSSAGYRQAKDRARQLMNDADAATSNQQLIEFGALQCIPGKPACPSCPLKESCYAYAHGMVDLLPVTKRSRDPRKRYFQYLLIVHDHALLMHERTQKDIWKGLWQFPLVESARPLPCQKVLQHARNVSGDRRIRLVHTTPQMKHRLTHQEISIRFFSYYAENIMPVNPYLLIPLPSLHEYPIPVPLHKILNHPDFPFLVE